MSWAAPLVRRTALLVVSLFVTSVVVFLLCAVLPGDPASVLLGVEATPEAVADLRRDLGVDRPLVTQYASWAGGLLQGDFGDSYVSRAPIGEQIGDRLGVTLSLVGGGMVVALLVALPLGVLAAVRHRRASGTAITVASQIGLAVPSFWAGLLLAYVFAVKLRWLPSAGYADLRSDPAQWLRHLILPWLALGAVQGAVLTRYVRTAVLDVMQEDYIRTARAVGHTSWGALWRHGMRNAAVPVVTVLGLQLATLLVGAILVESVFTLPGLGQILLQAVGNRDLLLVQGTVMVLAAAVLVVNWLVELAYLVIDPRLRVTA